MPFISKKDSRCINGSSNPFECLPYDLSAVLSVLTMVIADISESGFESRRSPIMSSTSMEGSRCANGDNDTFKCLPYHFPLVLSNGESGLFLQQKLVLLK